MSSQERAKQAAEQARQVAADAAGQAKAATFEATGRTHATLREPATSEQDLEELAQ